MPRIPDDELARIKRETDLAALARSRGVGLKPRGNDLVGRCPFHGPDDDPSFVVTPSKGLFHCFGCDAAGSAIDFLMLFDGVCFRNAVAMLREGHALETAPPSGRPLKSCTVPILPPPFDLDAKSHELLTETLSFYHQTLTSPAGRDGMRYLDKRRIADPKAVEHFKIGYSDSTLGARLPKANRSAGAEIRGKLQDLGLIRKTGFEHFAGSIVFPILDAEGEVGEVYARKVNDNRRKGRPNHLYLPGPHRGIWNLSALSDSKEIILCESIIDALSFWVAGFTNVTSAFGAGCFTSEQLEAFKAYGVERTLIAFDRDERGDKGALAVAERLAQAGIGCFRVLFPKDFDANEYACKVTPARKSLELLVRKAEWMAGPTTRSAPVAMQAPKKPMNSSVMAPQEALSPLAAASESPVVAIPQEIPGSAPPPPASRPAATVEAEVTDQEVVILLGDRRWRVRGLSRNLSYEQLKVNLLVSRDAGQPSFYVDALNLYAAKARAAFVKQAAAELGVKENVAKKDLAKVFMKLEELLDHQIQAALSPKKAPAVSISAEGRAEALQLLKDPRLLERIVADFETCGLVGEHTNKLTGYLAAISRKLDKPLAVMVQSSSAAGKSALMDAVLGFIPSEQRVQYSAMTGQSLFYMGEADLKHKVLAIAEEEGAERASYALKLLQSEGKLSIASTGKDPSTGRLVTHKYHVEGPSAILLTTTAIDLDEELLNRCVVLTVDESREQTQAIHRMQRQSRTLEGLARKKARSRILKVHQNAQRLLRPLEVQNPYADELTFLNDPMRTRRDHEKYLTLIDALALLHQHQRVVKVDQVGGERVEYIEVALDDIAAANYLADEVLGRTLDELPPQTRRLLMLVEQMVADTCSKLDMERADYRFTRRDVRAYSGWGNTQLKVHMARLEDMEYLLVHRGGRGQSFVYELLYDGRGKQGERFLLALTDLSKLKPGYQYDLKWSGSEGNRSAPSRPQVGGMSGGGRDGSTLPEKGDNPGFEVKPPEKAHQGSKKVGQSNPQPAVIAVAAKAGE